MGVAYQPGCRCYPELRGSPKGECRFVSAHAGHNPSREGIWNPSPEALGRAFACGIAVTKPRAGCRS